MLTFEEFRKLPRSEQNVRYRELSDHDKFLARMNDYSSEGVVSTPPKDGYTPEQIAANEILNKFVREFSDK